VVAEEICKIYDHVDYFPSYEIITGNYNRGQYFADDLREVLPEGVEHVMRIFMKHYTGAELSADSVLISSRSSETLGRRRTFFDVVCDEEAIANF
jgi:hypothetical protein